MMKFVLLIVCSIISSHIESEFHSNKSSYEDQRLESIRENFRNINKIEDWTSIKELNLNESTEGGSATYFNSNATLLKVSVVYFGEKGKNTQEFYTNNGELSFVLENHFEYNRPITYDSLRMVESNDNQIYHPDSTTVISDSSFFVGGTLIRQINNQDCGSPFAKDYIQLEQKRLSSNFRKLKTLLKQ